MLLHPVPSGENKYEESFSTLNMRDTWKRWKHKVKVKNKNISSDEEGIFMSESIIQMIFLVSFLCVVFLGMKQQSPLFQIKTVCVKAGGHCSTAPRSLSRLVVKPSAPYQSFTHAEGSYMRGRDFSTSSWGDALLPLDVHTSSFGCHSAVFILFLCSKSEVSHVQKRPPEWCTCVSMSGSINTTCYQLLQLINLGTVAGTWELKHCAQSMGGSEKMDTPQNSACTQQIWVVIIEY